MTVQLDANLTEALTAAEANPEDARAWEALEALVEQHQHQAEVGALYRRSLSGGRSSEAFEALGRRAIAFHEEWFGEDSTPFLDVLTAVLEVEPAADWALSRITVALTMRGRFRDLLERLDRALETPAESWRRGQWLEEAAQVAKDFAGEPDRAIEYQRALLVLRPDDAALGASIERMLEAQGRWADLVESWRVRVRADAEHSDPLRLRIAETCLDPLGDADAAVAEVGEALAAGRPITAFVGLLETLVARPGVSAQARAQVVTWLRDHHEAAGRGADVERVLAVALGFANAHEGAALERELTARAEARGDLAAAFQHCATWLLRDPRAAAAEDKLRALAASTGAHGAHADALVEAAGAAGDPGRRDSLVLAAAEVRRLACSDAEGAEALLRRVLEADDAEPGSQQLAARRLVALLDAEDREVERLAALERLARLETDPRELRRILGQAGRLASKLDDHGRALALWSRRLEGDPQDLEALDACITVLGRAAQWAALVEMLGRRAAMPLPAPLRRADRARIARVQDVELGLPAEADETWAALADEFGEDAETVDARSVLLAAASRWTDLAAMLERAAARDEARAVDLAVRLSDARREHLGEPLRAAAGYHQALKLDPRHAGARAGLGAIATNPEARAAAVEALADAALRMGDAPAVLALLEDRLALAGEGEQVRLWLEAARLEEELHGPNQAALRAVRSAFALRPDDVALEASLMRLGAATSAWPDVIEALSSAAGALRAEPRRAARLFRSAAECTEREGADPSAALAWLREAFALEPHDLVTASEVIRLAAAVGAWTVAAGSWVGVAMATRRQDPSLLAQLEDAAEAADAWGPLTEAATAALTIACDRARDEGAPLGALGRELWGTIAAWNRDRRDDLAAAERAVQQALANDPHHVETLRVLGQLQWRAPSRALVTTLTALSDRLDDDLDALWDAAKIALDPVGDASLARPLLARLLRVSARLWESGATPRGQRKADVAARDAVEAWARLELEAGQPSAAVEVLLRGAQLPFDAEEVRALLRRAADLARGPVGDEAWALRLDRRIVEASLADPEAVDRIAQDLLRRDRVVELLALRQRELAEPLVAERRVAVRLEVAQLLGRLERQGGRLEMLRANLVDLPGHPPSIEEACAALEGSGRTSELFELLTAQARKLEDADAAGAARLWGLVARLAEGPMADPDRAIAAHRRVVAVAPSTSSLDALASLYLAKEDPSSAADWLERRLEFSTDDERSDIALRLAEARFASGRTDRALRTLERALEQDPASDALRDKLASGLRRGESHRALARVLEAGAEQGATPERRLAYARESAETYRARLGDSAAAVPVLRLAVALAPEDPDLRRALAEGLCAAGLLDEARLLLEALVADFGRRRSTERAALHFQLAQVAQAAGDTGQALDQLDKASGMDLAHPGILRMLGDVARDAGLLDRAERAYRALLLIVRRPQSDRQAPACGVAEVFLELSRLAGARQQPAQAKELLTSAFEAAEQNAVEAQRFTRALLAHGDFGAARTVVDLRLAAAGDDARLRASALDDHATLLESTEGQSEAALEARLASLELVPGRAAAAAARSLAKRLGASRRYVEHVGVFVGQMRRKEDAEFGSELLLSAAEAAEDELGDHEVAATLYHRTEGLGARTLDAWRGLARVAAARGDHVDELRVLRRLLAAGVDTSGLGGADAASEEARAEALFRIAEVELEDPATVDAGLVTLVEAVTRSGQPARGARALAAAWSRHEDHAGLRMAYERMARSAGDRALLLDCLDALARVEGASLERIREGAELAGALGDGARADALLVVGVEAARATHEGLAGHPWWTSGLARSREAAGDLEGALHWRTQAAEAAEAQGGLDAADPLWREVASFAAASAGDPGLAASIARRLFAHRPTELATWAMLAETHAASGELEALDATVDAALVTFTERADRTALRMHQAAFRLGTVGGETAARGALEAVLEEEPDHLEAAQHLGDVLERRGEVEALADLLRGQLQRAIARRDGEASASLALRLGRGLEATRPQDAAAQYRLGLAAAPHDRGLLTALLSLSALLTPEDDAARGELLEALLSTATGSEVAASAAELAALRARQGDVGGVGRALELGFRKAPSDASLRMRLESWLAEHGDDLARAEFMAFDAGHRDDPQQRIARYVEAADLATSRLARPDLALAWLRQAQGLAPEDLDLRAATVAALLAEGRLDHAKAEVEDALQVHAAPTRSRARALRMRASLVGDGGVGASVLSDLDEAYVLDAEATHAALAVALERASGDGASPDARAHSMRLSELLQIHGDAERSREVLAAWAAGHPADLEVHRRLLAADTAAGRWEDVLVHCARLVDADEGQAQVDAVLAWAKAAEKAGRPGDALAGLERVHRDHPGEARVRDALRAAYSASGAHLALAEVWLSDAASATSDDARFEALRRAGELFVGPAGDPRRAVEALRAALSLREDDADTIVLLTDAWIAAGGFTEAVELLQTAIASPRRRRSPALAAMQFRMARIAGLSGDQDTQLEWLKVALETDKTHGGIAAELAELAMALHDDVTAMNALKVVTLQKTPGPMSKGTAFLRQAQLAQRGGDTQKALLWARRARIEESDFKEAEEFLRSLGEG